MSNDNSWQTRELQELVVIDPEVLRENTDRHFHFHYIDIASVSNGRIEVPSDTIAFCDSPSRARKVVRCGDVLMSTVRPNLKAFAYFDQPLDDCVASTGFAVLRARRNVDSRFVLYSILSESVTRQIEAHVVGSNYPAINSTAVGRLKVLTPASDEQAKIAEILSTVDRAIEQTEALIAKQQRIKTGLMQVLLTRGIDEHGNLRSEETHQFKDSPLGRIPVEWTAAQIGKVAILQRGHDITEEQLQDGPFPVISSSGVVGYHSQATSKAPNVVVGRKGTIGKVHFLEDDFWAHDTSLYVTNFWGNHEQFIYYLFCYLDLARFGTKSGSPSLNRNDIHPLWIGRPPHEEQVQITETLLQSDRNQKSLELDLGKYRLLKTALMQDLLTGKKRVTPLLSEVSEIPV